MGEAGVCEPGGGRGNNPRPRSPALEAARAPWTATRAGVPGRTAGRARRGRGPGRRLGRGSLPPARPPAPAPRSARSLLPARLARLSRLSPPPPVPR